MHVKVHSASGYLCANLLRDDIVIGLCVCAGSDNAGIAIDNGHGEFSRYGHELLGGQPCCAEISLGSAIVQAHVLEARLQIRPLGRQQLCIYLRSEVRGRIEQQ